jgi:hypothetical protein
MNTEYIEVKRKSSQIWGWLLAIVGGLITLLWIYSWVYTILGDYTERYLRNEVILVLGFLGVPLLLIGIVMIKRVWLIEKTDSENKATENTKIPWGRSPTSDNLQRIIASDKLVNWFGYWPMFHDAEIMWIKLERKQEVSPNNVSVEFLIHTWELTNITMANGFLKMVKHCLVHFSFNNCADIKLYDFNHQNQIYSIDFYTEKQQFPLNKVMSSDYVVRFEDNYTVMPEEILAVDIMGAFGIHGSFKCYMGEVESIFPCDEKGNLLEEKPI